MKKHVIISFDVETDETAASFGIKISQFKTTPSECGIVQADIEAALCNSVRFRQYANTQQRAMIVSGSRTVTDSLLIETVLKEMTTVAPFDEPPVMILNSTPGPAFVADSFAKLHNYKIIRITPDWDRYGKIAGGVCALDMLDTLNVYQHPSVLLIWDEETTEVPYFFEPTLDLNINLFVYSTKRNRWLHVSELQSTIDEFHERVASARLTKEKRDNAIAVKTS